MTEALPLSGLNIVVTRPREQAVLLALGIEKLGGTCIRFPLLEITPLAEDQALREASARLREYQLIIFISPNAVRYGMAAIQQAGGMPAGMQVATIGLGSARELQQLGVQHVISPSQRFDSESLLALPEMHDVNGKRVLIFRGDSGRELLGDTLKSRGARVDYVTCYHRSQASQNPAPLLAAKVDALCVSSSEAMNHLAAMLQAEQQAQLASTPLFVAHERIATLAGKLGWQHIITVSGGDEGLLAGLCNWAEHRKGRQS